MSILHDYAIKARIAADRGAPAEQRVFAALEMACQPVSFLTIAALIALPLLARCGVAPPGWFSGTCFPIMVSAAVGYMTNWIAIEMLFKPYERTWRHPLPVITLGYWRQGLVPKNKGRIARVMGEQVSTKLLQPKKLADDLCSMVGGVLENPKIVSSIQAALQKQVAAHDKEIASFLIPRLEQAMIGEIDRLVTSDNVQKFWDEQIDPYLQSEDTRAKIAQMLVDAIRKRSPDIASRVKPWLVRAIRGWCSDKAGAASVVLEPLAGRLADFLISEKTIENGLKDWLKRPETATMLRDELSHYVQALRDYLQSPDARGRVGDFVQDLRGRFKEYLRTYLEHNLESMAKSVLQSEDLWKWAAGLLPQMRPELEGFIRAEGTDLIIERLDVQGRIKTAVDQMDMREFHGMIGEVAAQHLGAIQVLGYVLGAVAGALSRL